MIETTLLTEDTTTQRSEGAREKVLSNIRDLGVDVTDGSDVQSKEIDIADLRPEFTTENLFEASPDKHAISEEVRKYLDFYVQGVNA